ncbi:MAG: SUMF1/EgtB/PvdO family nonheme iron enzyme [Lentisphaerota bacterium]
MKSNDAAAVKKRRHEKWECHRLEIHPPVGLDFVRMPFMDLWISRRLVCRAAFHCFRQDVAGNPVDPLPSSGGQRAVLEVSWNEAARFCKWLNTRHQAFLPDGWLFRLPTTAEWESCLTGRFVPTPPWGENCPDFGDVQCFEKIKTQGERLLPFFSIEPPHEPSIWQWTGDLYDPEANLRILRGACWYGRLEERIQMVYCRTPYPDAGRPDVSFRVVAAPA